MRAAPYGATEATRAWAERRGLRYVPHVSCLHWIAIGRCGVGLCREGPGTRDWMEHVSGWLGDDGRRLLICQPYQFRDLGALTLACSHFGLDAIIHGAGWYGSGTVCIELTKADPVRVLRSSRHRPDTELARA